VLDVGKTNLLSRYAEGRFSSDFEATLGCEYTSKVINVSEGKVLVQIWDTAGQEAYRAITRSYYQKTSCAVVVFDLTDMKTFEQANEWYVECKEMCSRNVEVVMVGNKKDLEKERVVSYEQAKQYAEENEIEYFETSALSGEGVKELFEFIVDVLVDKARKEEAKMGMNDRMGGIVLNKDKAQGEDEQEKKCLC
jgi:small GTP-binding protein